MSKILEWLRLVLLVPVILLFATAGSGGGSGSSDTDEGDGDKGGQGKGDGDEDEGDGDDEDELKDLPDEAKAIVRKERQARKSLEKQIAKLAKAQKKAEQDRKQSQQRNATEEEKKLAAAREEAAKEATKAAEGKLKKAAVISAAAGKMANPKLAAKLLDLDDLEVDDDGDVDDVEVAKLIDDLLEENPELAADRKGKARKSGGDFSKENKGDSGKPNMDNLLRIAARRG